MKQVVWVVEKQGNEAIVEMRRHSACGSCGACWTGDEPKRFTVLNPHDFDAETMVTIELPDGSFLKAVFLVYMSPIIGGGLVAWIGHLITGGLSDGLLCILFMTGIAIAFALLRTYDNRAIFRNSYLPVIVRGADEDEE